MQKRGAGLLWPLVQLLYWLTPVFGLRSFFFMEDLMRCNNVRSLVIFYLISILFLISCSNETDKMGDSKVPKFIWSFWAQGEDQLPAFNKYNVNHWRKVMEPMGFQIRVLNDLPGHKDNAIAVLGDKSLLPKTYDKLEELATSYKGPENTWFDLNARIVRSDCVRIAVLEKFGGTWMDTSIVLVKDLNSIVINNLNNSDKNVGGYIMRHLTSPNSPMVDGIRVDGMENWFIVAKKGSPLIHEWRKAFSRYWETRKPGQWISDHEMYKDPRFSFGGTNNQEYVYANYLNQHAALKYVLFYQPELGQEILPIKNLHPWWLKERAEHDHETLLAAATKGDLKSKVKEIRAEVGLMKFPGSVLGEIKAAFPTISDFCTKPNIFQLIYGHCP